MLSTQTVFWSLIAGFCVFLAVMGALSRKWLLFGFGVAAGLAGLVYQGNALKVVKAFLAS